MQAEWKKRFRFVAASCVVALLTALPFAFGRLADISVTFLLCVMVSTGLPALLLSLVLVRQRTVAKPLVWVLTGGIVAAASAYLFLFVFDTAARVPDGWATVVEFWADPNAPTMWRDRFLVSVLMFTAVPIGLVAAPLIGMWIRRSNP
jgi:hypothetical protein